MGAAPASRPRLLVVAGPNGAGKTTITERGLALEWFHDCECVNPDAIAQDELGDWNDAKTDNSVDDRDAQLVLRAAEGRVMKAYGDAPAWSGPIVERLAPRES